MQKRPASPATPGRSASRPSPKSRAESCGGRPPPRLPRAACNGDRHFGNSPVRSPAADDWRSSARSIASIGDGSRRTWPPGRATGDETRRPRLRPRARPRSVKSTAGVLHRHGAARFRPHSQTKSRPTPAAIKPLRLLVSTRQAVIESTQRSMPSSRLRFRPAASPIPASITSQGARNAANEFVKREGGRRFPIPQSALEKSSFRRAGWEPQAGVPQRSVGIGLISPPRLRHLVGTLIQAVAGQRHGQADHHGHHGSCLGAVLSNCRVSRNRVRSRSTPKAR